MMNEQALILLTDIISYHFFTLNQNQYLSDIIDDLYWKKEHYEFYTVYSDDCLRD